MKWSTQVFQLTSIFSCIYNKNKKKKKVHVMRTLRIYSLCNFPYVSCSRVNYSRHMFYVFLVCHASACDHRSARRSTNFQCSHVTSGESGGTHSRIGEWERDPPFFPVPVSFLCFYVCFSCFLPFILLSHNHLTYT